MPQSVPLIDQHAPFCAPECGWFDSDFAGVVRSETQPGVPNDGVAYCSNPPSARRFCAWALSVDTRNPRTTRATPLIRFLHAALRTRVQLRRCCDGGGTALFALTSFQRLRPPIGGATVTMVGVLSRAGAIRQPRRFLDINGEVLFG